MRTGSIAAFTFTAALSFPLWANPLPETENSPAKAITKLLERISAGASAPVTYQHACQVSTGEYGLELEHWHRSYCQYLSQGRYRISEEFTPLYLDEETLHASVEEFLQENNRQSGSYWEFEDNKLRYVYNSGDRKEHILQPRQLSPRAGSGSGFEFGISTAGSTGTPAQLVEDEFTVRIIITVFTVGLLVLFIIGIAIPMTGSDDG